MRKRKFRGRCRVRVRCVENDDPAFGRRRDVNVVDAYTGSANCLEPMARRNDGSRDPCLGTHDERIVVGNAFAQGRLIELGPNIHDKSGARRKQSPALLVNGICNKNPGRKGHRGRDPLKNGA